MKSLFVAWLLSVLALTAADAPATFKVGDYTFTRPVKWEWVEVTSPMRKAQLRVPGKETGADVIFFFFAPGEGGGKQANVDRWLNQFSDAKDKKVVDAKVGKNNVTWVSTEGTYSGGMPGQPRQSLPNYALVGAIIESSGGNVFVKMAGPTTVVQQADAEFRSMVQSALK